MKASVFILLAIMIPCSAAVPCYEARNSAHSLDTQATQQTPKSFAPPAPPYTYLAPDAPSAQHLPLELTKVSAKKDVRFVLLEQWMEERGLLQTIRNLRSDQVEQSHKAARLPDFIPRSFNELPLVKFQIGAGNRLFLSYGKFHGDRSYASEPRYLVAMDSEKKELLYVFDFDAWSFPPRYVPSDKDFVYQKVVWAEERNGILYVCHAHSTYARSSEGSNGYLSAIRLSDGHLVWRTQPLVSNAANFLIHGNQIISGYGFTNEPDYVYIVDLGSGRVLKKVLVQNAPDFFVLEGEKLTVRTYDMEYVFIIGAGAKK